MSKTGALGWPVLCSVLFVPGISAAQSPNADSDGDGVPDAADSFPCDASSTGESYSPSLGNHGLLMSEDFWPVRLDDDYQDAVIAYNYGFKVNVGGQVTSLRATFDVIAAGGIIDLGLGLRLPLPASTVHNMSATIGGQPHPITHPGDTNLTHVVLSDIRTQLFPPGTPKVINANPSSPAVANVGPLEVVIDFNPAVDLQTGQSPFDVYIFRGSAPGHEVHLSQYCGTANMTSALFGTGIDNSNPPSGPCYVDGQGLPSMLHVPSVVGYPLEATDIALLYPAIVPWAASGGTTNQDWFNHPASGFAYSTPLSPAFNGSPQLSDPTSCSCPSGYTGMGGACQDVNECGNGTANCSVNATCTNTDGGFSCACNPGYTGDGVTCTPTAVCNGNGRRDGSETGIDCGPGCGSCLRVPIEGHADVIVGCSAGDYSCQAHLVCNAVTGLECVHQQYDCFTGGLGSWYPPDGSSGGSNFNFAYAYDFGGGTSNYGNICACIQSQMSRYGLAATHQYCGLGHWFRITVPQTCSDGLLNQDELQVDCGGSCTPCVPTCSDGMQNQGETGVDCGGPCSACPTCSDGIRNQNETGVDCGGVCPACPAVMINVEGRPNPIPVNCPRGDFSCQAREICQVITGVTCVHQQYDCYTGSQGSWYPLDGVSGGSNFNFAYAYDFGGGTSNYGNICACTQSQMSRYGLAATHQYCGLGHWQRVP